MASFGLTADDTNCTRELALHARTAIGASRTRDRLEQFLPTVRLRSGNRGRHPRLRQHSRTSEAASRDRAPTHGGRIRACSTLFGPSRQGWDLERTRPSPGAELTTAQGEFRCRTLSSGRSAAISHAVPMPLSTIPIAGGRNDGTRFPNLRTDVIVPPTNALDALQMVGSTVLFIRMSVTPSRDRLDGCRCCGSPWRSSLDCKEFLLSLCGAVSAFLLITKTRLRSVRSAKAGWPNNGVARAESTR